MIQQKAAPNQQTANNLDGPRLGGTPLGDARPVHGGISDDATQPDVDRNTGVRDEEYVPEFPRGLIGQSGNMDRGQPLVGNTGLADIIRRTIRRGLTNRDSEGVNKSPFTRNIRTARNPPDFKLPTLEVYNEKTNPTDHLMRYTRHMEVLGAMKEVMA